MGGPGKIYVCKEGGCQNFFLSSPPYFFFWNSPNISMPLKSYFTDVRVFTIHRVHNDPFFTWWNWRQVWVALTINLTKCGRSLSKIGRSWSLYEPNSACIRSEILLKTYTSSSSWNKNVKIKEFKRVLLFVLHDNCAYENKTKYYLPDKFARNVPVKGAVTVVKHRTSTGTFQANYKWEENNNWGDTLCLVKSVFIGGVTIYFVCFKTTRKRK